jgi:acyl-CoA thioester hydrolase
MGSCRRTSSACACRLQVLNSFNRKSKIGNRKLNEPFRITERVRWIDCDAAQIIYYGSYIRFFEIAETEMYRSVGLPYAVAFKALNCFPIRRVYHCEYIYPARLDDLIEIAVWISRWGRTSFTISFRITIAGADTLLAEGYCGLVTVGLDDKRPLPIPGILREKLACYSMIATDDEAAPESTPGI